MAAEIPSKELTEVFAGDTVAWTKDLSDYPASTYTLKYYLRGPGDIDITATADGATHEVSVAASVTATWPKGTYQWKSFVSSGSERYFVEDGEIEVLENPQLSKLTFDTRSINKQILDALEAVMLRSAARPEKGYQIEAAGRSFTFHTHEELIMAIEKFRGWVKQEEDAKKLERGEGTGRNILVRFN
jgi:hypothetical protein